MAHRSDPFARDDASCRALLFVRDADGEAGRAAVQAFTSVDWPSGCRSEVIDVDRDEETARWFGIETWPTVAIVHDGMLLAIEHGCSRRACQRALQAARPRQRDLRRHRV